MAQRKRRYRDGLNAQEFRERILDAAAEQFAVRSYAQTTMSAIASAVDIDQSSLYHWFSSKADIASSLLQRANDPLAFLGDMTMGQAVAAHGARAVLVAAVYHDVRTLCLSQLDYYELESALSQAQGAVGYDEPYRRLAATLAELVALGESAGELSPVGDARATAFAILTMDEGLQHRFRQGQGGSAGLSSGDAAAASVGAVASTGAVACGADAAAPARDAEGAGKGAAAGSVSSIAANPVTETAESCARFAARCALRLVGASDRDIDHAWSDACSAGWTR